MADLADQIAAALDQAERQARAATPGPWHALDGGVTDDDHEQWPVADIDSTDSRADRVFIAANSPDVALRVIAAHRSVVERHQPDPDRPSPLGTLCEYCSPPGLAQTEWPCPDLRDIASIYLPPQQP
jgi:hypothetical protein